MSVGGARRFAHIGVPKVNEINRLPIDYIAGTGMLPHYRCSLNHRPEPELGSKDIIREKIFDNSACCEFTTCRCQQDDLDFSSIYGAGITGFGTLLSPALNLCCPVPASLPALDL